MCELGIVTVSDDLATIGLPRIVLSRPCPGELEASAGVRAGFGHRGAVVWQDGSGCSFVALAEDGSASSAPIQVTTSTCWGFQATPSGFILLDEQNTLVTLDASGNVVDMAQLATTTAAARMSVFDDGSVLVAGSSDGASLSVQAFSSAGQPLSPPQAVPNVHLGLIGGANTPDDEGLGFAMAGLGSSAFVASTSPDPSDSVVADVAVEAFDEQGDVAGASILPPHVAANSLDIAADGEEAVVAWTDASNIADSGVEIAAIWSDGTPDGAPFWVPLTPSSTIELRVARTQGGAMIVYAPAVVGTLRVDAVRLRCDRRP